MANKQLTNLTLMPISRFSHVGNNQILVQFIRGPKCGPNVEQLPFLLHIMLSRTQLVDIYDHENFLLMSQTFQRLVTHTTTTKLPH
jgi:hypothetical protein